MVPMSDPKLEGTEIADSVIDLFGETPFLIRRMEFGQKGAFHVLRVGPFEDAKSARSLCAALAERTVDCFVVRG